MHISTLQRGDAQPMKALTLYQPWASLMAFREKTIETRSWATTYRGPLAIHASKYTPKKMYDAALNSVWFQTAVNTHGVSFVDLPRSRVLCIVELVGCFRTTELHKAEFLLGHRLDRKEIAFGDYGLGRYAWVTRFVELVEDEGPTQGGQRLWSWLRGRQSAEVRQEMANEAVASGEASA